jgi:hypothetical protein
MVTLLQPSQGCSTPGTRPLTADRPPAEVAVWNHPIRVTTVPPGRVQGEYHGDTPAVKVENVADDGIQWEVEGGDHRLLLRLDHGGQSPPVTRWPRTAAAAGTWWAVSSSTSARHRRASTQDGAAAGPTSEVHPLANEAASRPLDQPPPGHRYRVPVHRRRDDARRRAEPPRPGGAPPGRDWPVALATGGCEASLARTRLGGPRAPCRHRNGNKVRMTAGRPSVVLCTDEPRR